MAPFDSSDKHQSRYAFAERLRLALQQSGYSASPTQLALEFNARFSGPKVHMATCRKWLLGESIPTQEKLVTLAQMIGVTADWLRYGPASTAEEKSAPLTFNAHELSLLNDLHRLKERDQRLVHQMVDMLLRAD